jgi:hypothetical protein
MINSTDQDIAEALRLQNYTSMEIYNADEILAHARTIAQLRVAADALEAISLRDYDHAVSGHQNYADAESIADATLNQIRSNTNEQAD